MVVSSVEQREIVEVPFIMPDGSILPHPALVISRAETRKVSIKRECYEERDKSKRNFQSGGIRIMDVVADADGNLDQDIRRFPNYEDKQEEGLEIQYDLVLGDRLCCIENQGVLSSSGKNIRLILAIDAIRFNCH